MLKNGEKKIILSNLENLNADLIENGISQKERLIMLNKTAKNQVELLENNKNIKELESLQAKVDKNNSQTYSEEL